MMGQFCQVMIRHSFRDRTLSGAHPTTGCSHCQQKCLAASSLDLFFHHCMLLLCSSEVGANAITADSPLRTRVLLSPFPARRAFLAPYHALNFDGYSLRAALPPAVRKGSAFPAGAPPTCRLPEATPRFFPCEWNRGNSTLAAPFVFKCPSQLTEVSRFRLALKSPFRIILPRLWQWIFRNGDTLTASPAKHINSSLPRQAHSGGLFKLSL